MVWYTNDRDGYFDNFNIPYNFFSKTNVLDGYSYEPPFVDESYNKQLTYWRTDENLNILIICVITSSPKGNVRSPEGQKVNYLKYFE